MTRRPPRAAGAARALAAFGAVVAAAACTGSPAPEVPPSSTPSGMAPSGVSPATDPALPVPSGRAAPTPVVEVTARLRLPAGMHVTTLALGGDLLAWSGCLPCSGAAKDATEVYVGDLSGGKARAVARTRFRWGSTAVVGLGAGTLVWLDGTDERDGLRSDARWALRATQLRSGATWTVAEGGVDGEPPRTPIAFVRGDVLTWQLFGLAPARGPVREVDLTSRRTRLVTADLPGRLRGVTAAGVVFTATDPTIPTVVPDAPVPLDAYLRRPGVAGQLPLSTDHDVLDVGVSDTVVLWSTRQGDGESLLVRPLSTGAARRVFAGPVLAFAAVRGVAVWTTRETRSVAQVGAGGRVLTLPDIPADPRFLAVDRDRVALLTVPGRDVTGPVTALVLRVAAGR